MIGHFQLRWFLPSSRDGLTQSTMLCRYCPSRRLFKASIATIILLCIAGQPNKKVSQPLVLRISSSPAILDSAPPNVTGKSWLMSLLIICAWFLIPVRIHPSPGPIRFLPLSKSPAGHQPYYADKLIKRPWSSPPLPKTGAEAERGLPIPRPSLPYQNIAPRKIASW
jgi:hypothetical protein